MMFGSGAEMKERRDFASRTEMVRRLIELLVAHRDGVALPALDSHDVPIPAAERILKPLAVKGLVKIADGKWAPTHALLAGVQLPVNPE